MTQHTISIRTPSKQKQVDNETSQEASGQESSKPLFPFAGIFAQLLASVLFSFSVLCIKLLPQVDGGLVDKTRAMCFRGLFLACLSGFSMLCKGQKFLLERNEIWIVSCRCSFAFLGIYGSYLSLEYINLGDSTAIVYSPIWTSILGCLLLKEPFKVIQVFAIPASLVGIILIGHPSLITDQFSSSSSAQSNAEVQVIPVVDSMDWPEETSAPIEYLTHQYDFEHRWPGLVLALASSLAVAFTYITFRVNSSTPIQTTTFWLGVSTAGATIAVMTVFGFGQVGLWPREPIWYLIMFGNSFFTWIGQAFLQYALRYEAASLLSVVRTFDVLMTFTLGAFILDEKVPTTSLFGASLIGLVVVSIVSNDFLANYLKQRRLQKKQVAEEQQQQQREDTSDHRKSISVISLADSYSQQV